MLYDFIGECELPHVLHVLHIVERNALQVNLWYLLDVFLVLLTHHDIGDTGTLGCKDLLLDTAYGQHSSAQGDLARHRRVLTHLALGEGRGNRGGDGDTGRRSVFRRGAFGHVDMDVPVVEDAVVDIQRLGMGLHVFHREDGRLLHHVSEITCQREF